jgi:hypothetical protein
MMRTKHLVIASLVLIVISIIVWLFSASTEAPEPTPMPQPVIMAEPQDFRVERSGTDNYMRRAIFIEKIRNALLLDSTPTTTNVGG